MSYRMGGIIIHVEKLFAFDRDREETREAGGNLYTHAQRCTGCWIGAENINSEVGSRFLPGGVVVSKEEKGRTLALSLTHRVGGVKTA